MEILYNDILEMVKSSNNADNINEYELVNNYGVTFDLKGKHYDLRHVTNVYGVRVNNLVLTFDNTNVYMNNVYGASLWLEGL